MLTVDKNKRIKTQEAAKHKWFDCIDVSDSSSPTKRKFTSPMSAEVLTKLTEFKSESLLK